MKDICHIQTLRIDELPLAYSLLRILRPHLNEEAFKRIYEAAEIANKYRFVGAWMKGELIGLLGVRELHDYVHDTHWYIDDLIVSSEFRSQGIGAHLLKWIVNEARLQKVLCLRLSTGVQNSSAMKFYEREGWEVRSVTYKKFLP
jgi:ribosomal protein S18 acetylase RimI-like enzyme